MPSSGFYERVRALAGLTAKLGNWKNTHRRFCRWHGRGAWERLLEELIDNTAYYCLSYRNWTVIPHQWEECFGTLADSGYDNVALSYSESEQYYARCTLEKQIETVHKHSLNVFVVPSHPGGCFAGAPMMHCNWLTENPESCLPGWPTLAYLESKSFRD